ncbi:efflux RND transporter permease subunit [Methylicorpusculum sp.]|uniref:efflux RND transporter permease subunit n=3 Tax=Methylicorpusculum sp. TaxID=2713644 RepID=UPI00273509F8|nr:efflux RND transporter permease subunit [Methylicorpusculum sp.]MDP3528559.1 efflux RND transporter permease subunit [Methylicorpusculum sp.]
MQTLQPAISNGPISWMSGHPVAANLAMLVLVVGGYLFMQNIPQEVFPNTDLDAVNISVSYPGASPEEIEQGIILSLEQAVSGLEGVEDINSTATEGLATVIVTTLRGTDMQRFIQDVQKEVDRITTLPLDAEQPQTTQVTGLRPLMELVIFGEAPESTLHELGEQLRDRFLQDPGITQVNLFGIKPMEISVEVSQENLRRHKLSLGDIAQRIANANLDLPTGSIKTDTGEILLRMKERKDYGQQFAKLPLITTLDGSQVLLGDIAAIKDGYDISDYYAIYDGKPAVMIQIYNVGDQSPLDVSSSVTRIMETAKLDMPEGVKALVRRDSSLDYNQRIDLLMRNAAMGLALVIITLALFLELRLAFWVMTGIPIAFLGSFLILPALGVTLNMISLFAFIIALGIVVDDAIIIGENIYHYLQEGMQPYEAAVKGAREMAMPVTFSILTNVAAFMPLLFIPGVTGKIYVMVPLVIITVFLLSLFESLFILPNHLSRLKKPKAHGIEAWIHTYQQKFSKAFRHWVLRRYGPFLDWSLQHHYLIVLFGFALLFATFSFALSGRIGFTAFPKTESDFSRVAVSMPFGTPAKQTEIVVQHLTEAAQRVAESIPDGDKLLIGVFAELGSSMPGVMAGGHIANVRAYLAPPEIREKIMSTEQFTQRWREEAGEIVGAESVVYESDFGGPGSGAAITVELNHRNVKILEAASAQLAEILRSYPAAINIKNEISAGKEQLDFQMRSEGLSQGLTPQNVARQVRNAFFGAEVLRQQRGRNEMKIMVRLPESERLSLQNVNSMLIWSANKKEIPLTEAVHVERGRAFTQISRRDGRRINLVTADLAANGHAGEIMNDLKLTELPGLVKQFPGLQFSFQGKQAEMGKSLDSLKIGFSIALFAIYVLLAIPFKSYSLPLIVIITIPFGAIGAIFGHLLMGYDLSLISILGIVALSGIVINDSLVLIDHAKELRHESNKTAQQTIRMAAVQRFRPIVLTSLTTFFGIMPMILETSRQAKMLIPMAISIGFGILFATVITLILIPSLYLVVDDLKAMFTKKHH